MTILHDVASAGWCFSAGAHWTYFISIRSLWVMSLNGRECLNDARVSGNQPCSPWIPACCNCTIRECNNKQCLQNFSTHPEQLHYYTASAATVYDNGANQVAIINDLQSNNGSHEGMYVVSHKEEYLLSFHALSRSRQRPERLIKWTRVVSLDCSRFESK